jgi:hypothetical protein
MLRPVDKQSGRKRQTSETERHKLSREKQKADWRNRNPDSKWK